MGVSAATAPLTSPGRRVRVLRAVVETRRDPAVALAALVVAIALLFALLPGLFAPYPPNEIGTGQNLAAPSWDHPLGTDEFGRDLLSRIIHGARVEVAISVLGVALAVAAGIPLGVLAGYRGGLADGILMRLQDALLAFPAVLFAILVVAALGASQRSIILTIGVVYLPRFARLVRGSVMVLKEEEFVVASRACGADGLRIVLRHILPNCLAPILVQTTLASPSRC